MKKWLSTVLSFVLIMSVWGSALAASSNPFVDVPSKHWAYDSISKLVKAGIIDGYGNGTFGGDKTMTRYEMAQIVAKALARSDKADADSKTLIDKLATEFSAELNNLGVRVSNLEERTKISWTFESRIRYGGDTNKAALNQGTNAFDWRQRIWLSGNVNDSVSYFGRLETTKTNLPITGNIPAGAPGNQTIGFNRAGFAVKDFLGCIDSLTIGRFGTMGWTPGLLQSRHAYNDGIAITKKMGDANFRASVFDISPQSQVNFASISFKPADNFKLGLAYQTENIAADAFTSWYWPTATYPAANLKTKSFDVNAVVRMGNFNLTGEYVTTKEQTNNDKTNKAYAFQITNGVTDWFYPASNIVNPTKAHTDAFAISYRSIERNAVPFTSGFWGASNVFSSVPAGGTASSYMTYDNDVKGYYLTYQNVVSKGIIWTAEYQSLKDKTTGSYSDNLWNTSFTFLF